MTGDWKRNAFDDQPARDNRSFGSSLRRVLSPDALLKGTGRWGIAGSMRSTWGIPISRASSRLVDISYVLRGWTQFSVNVEQGHPVLVLDGAAVLPLD